MILKISLIDSQIIHNNEMKIKKSKSPRLLRYKFLIVIHNKYYLKILGKTVDIIKIFITMHVL